MNAQQKHNFRLMRALLADICADASAAKDIIQKMRALHPYEKFCDECGRWRTLGMDELFNVIVRG